MQFFRSSNNPDNRKLERLLEVAQGTPPPGFDQQLFEQLRTSRVLVPTPHLGKVPTVRHEEDDTVDVGIVTHNGSVVVFTNEDALKRWREVGCTFMVLEVLKLLEIVVTQFPGLTLAINPCGPHPLFLNDNGLARMLGRAPDKERYRSDGFVLEPLPSPPPPRLSQWLREVMVAAREVGELWLAQGAESTPQAVHYVVVLGIISGYDYKDFMPGLVGRFRKEYADNPEGAVDFLPLGLTSALLERARTVGEKIQ